MFACYPVIRAVSMVFLRGCAIIHLGHTLTMELDTSGSFVLPTETWEIDSDNNTVTLTINDDD